MDLKAYYRKIREVESSIGEEFPVIKSLTTEAGGKAGHLTEATRGLAARMITEGTAELATAEEARKFRADAEEARKAEEKRQQASQIQFTVLSEADLHSLQRSVRSNRKE